MPREALLAELRHLSKPELELILKEFKPVEREQVLALVEAPRDTKSPAPFVSLAGLSPWLLKAIDPTHGPDRRKPLTAATRDALSEALERLAAEQAPKTAVDAKNDRRFASKLFRWRKGRRAS